MGGDLNRRGFLNFVAVAPVAALAPTLTFAHGGILRNPPLLFTSPPCRAFSMPYSSARAAMLAQWKQAELVRAQIEALMTALLNDPRIS
jgi:hypothetical protein